MSNQIETSLSSFVAAHPDLRYVYFGGKGGVGKTVLAGSAALALAWRGRRFMLASTNPVHSLSGLLGQNVFRQPTAVSGVPNLWAYEIDTKETIERSKVEIREKIQWFLKFADISTKAEDFVESAEERLLHLGGQIAKLLAVDQVTARIFEDPRLQVEVA
jgi:arsenite-transporting ATPase